MYANRKVQPSSQTQSTPNLTSSNKQFVIDTIGTPVDSKIEMQKTPNPQLNELEYPADTGFNTLNREGNEATAQQSGYIQSDNIDKSLAEQEHPGSHRHIRGDGSPPINREISAQGLNYDTANKSDKSTQRDGKKAEVLIEVKQQKVRSHGFSMPFSFLQVLAWIMAIFIITSFILTEICLLTADQRDKPT